MYRKLKHFSKDLVILFYLSWLYIESVWLWPFTLKGELLFCDKWLEYILCISLTLINFILSPTKILKTLSQTLQGLTLTATQKVLLAARSCILGPHAADMYKLQRLSTLWSRLYSPSAAEKCFHEHIFFSRSIIYCQSSLWFNNKKKLSIVNIKNKYRLAAFTGAFYDTERITKHQVNIWVHSLLIRWMKTYPVFFPMDFNRLDFLCPGKLILRKTRPQINKSVVCWHSTLRSFRIVCQ